MKFLKYEMLDCEINKFPTKFFVDNNDLSAFQEKSSATRFLDLLLKQTFSVAIHELSLNKKRFVVNQADQKTYHKSIS